MMRDLSEQGFAVRAMMPLQLSEKLPFSICLDNGVRIDGEAIVVRLEDKGHVAALEFAGLAAHSRDQIRRWLEKFEEPLAREAWAPQPPGARVSTLEELREEARKAIAEPVVAPLAPETGLLPPPLPQWQPPLAPEPPPPPASKAAAPVIPPPSMEFLAQPETEPIRLAPTPAAPIEQHFESAELPLPKFLRQPDNPPPPPEAPHLPPLLKLSSLRPGPASEPPQEPDFSVAHAREEEAQPAPNPVPLSEILIQPPSVSSADSLPPATPSPRVPSRVVPPPLEPLSPWETERGTASPGWMGSFTLGRAISIMVFLALLVGSVVYHREVGYAIIWLGQQIAGVEPQETSESTQPSASPAVSTPPESAPPANSSAAASSAVSTPPESAPPANSNAAASPAVSTLPEPAPPANSGAAASPATENPPVPHANANRAPEAAPADSSFGSGQYEYQRAMQILKAPGRKAELPEAVRLLWIAVKKNNVSAEITLAELYHQGRGVAKSCEQTKVLLFAAARKGSPDAKRRLQEFQREHCRD
jgi:hypothetical protein